MSSNFNELKYPDREDWLINMANVEYFADEIGSQWQRIRLLM